MSNIVKGRDPSDLVVKVGSRLRYSPGTGATVVDVYSCQTLAAAQSFFSSYIGGTVVADLNTQGPPYMVEISAPDSGSGNPENDYVDTWTMPNGEQHKSIFEHPYFQVIADAEMKVIRQYGATKDSDDFDDAVIAATSGNAIDLLNLLKKGTDTFLAAGANVKWTRTVNGSYSDAAFAQNGVRKIWTSSQLNALGPPAIIQALVNISAASIDAPDTGYLKGWLKKAVDVSPRGATRFDISQEWVLENWSTVLYSAY